MLAGALALATMLATPASAQETVVVTNRVVYPGETVTTETLDEVPLRRQLKNPAAVVYSRVELEGKVARRTLLPGRLIPVNSVREAYLVEPGSPVTVMFVHGPLSISATGVPLQAGAAGDLIKVRNLDSGTVVSGTVMADGTVRVGAS
ncbi:flagellar basal body P-ring formation protein FlgA [Aquamicrobium sp. LC103]|nr:flagellar basal body P-ring formation protein FlgA [Aquamicrobium sp. LC103]